MEEAKFDSLFLKHYGMPRRSGRYPWGSGETPYQSAISFKGLYDDLRSKGVSEKEIATHFGLSIAQLRAMNSVSGNEIRAAQTSEAMRLQAKGMSNVAIGNQMGLNESTVRSLLDPVKAERASITKATVNMLKDSVDKYGYIDVGVGVENYVGVNKSKLDTAVLELEAQGYKVHSVRVEQAGIPGQYTIMKALGGPDSDWQEVVRNPYLIQQITGRSDDLGRTYSELGLKPIQSVDSSRIMVRYGDEGGKLKDGVIELRRGVEDLDLGNSKYAQVRVGVDGSHYLKGMALYTDDIPDGVDVIFNTNKSPTGNKLDAMKKMKPDPDNPFGSTIKSIVDPDTGERIVMQKGALNIIREEGDWSTWSKSLSSQIMSKQSTEVTKKQLNLNHQIKEEEFNDIMKLTNPTIKKKLLMSFGDDVDAMAVDLDAAKLPRQSNKIILPIPGLKENEVYAPDYNNGESVVLIRHPHGGTFEIPELTVNNKSVDAKKIMENARDAIGINPKVAERLSGADFDGDTVIVVPNQRGAIKTQAALKDLKDFDHQAQYKGYDGMRTIDGGIYNAKTKEVDYGGKTPKKQNLQTEMGKISNLITDMTIKGASIEELARAVKHSMVVIDSEKHHLNYVQSFKDNGISSLKEKYQGGALKGASTIVSRASSEIPIPERKEGAVIEIDGRARKMNIDPRTGEKLYTLTGATYTKLRDTGLINPDTGKTLKEPVINKKTGEPVVVERTTTVPRMSIVADAHTLSSGTPMESIYADYANKMKALGNKARKEAIATTPTPYSPSAKVAYKDEVKSLEDKLSIAKKNAPREREAQIIANAVAAKKIQDNPGMTKEEQTKVKYQALAEARVRANAKKESVDITQNEWNAIQAGAVSTNTLTQILNNTKLDKVKELATPRQVKETMSKAKVTKAQNMLNSGYTQAEVAQALGVSVSLLLKELYK